ncbi:MAG: PRC-barrel domain-containing protein [Cyclobacteriaceae bacterium]
MATDNLRDKPYNPYLYKLKHLRDYKIDKHDPDVRGWDVYGRNREKLGKVDELIVDTEREKVRYLVVDVQNDIRQEIISRKPVRRERDDVRNNIYSFEQTDTGRKFLVPVGLVALQPDQDNVLVDYIDRERLRKHPVFEPTSDRPSREYERYLVDFYEHPEKYKSHISREDVDTEHIPLPPNAKHEQKDRPMSDIDKTGDPAFYEHRLFDDEQMYRRRGR